MELYKLCLILVWLSSSSRADKLTNALYNRFGVYESRFKLLKTGFQTMKNRMDVMEKKIYSKRLNCDVCVDDNKRLKQSVDNMQKAFDIEKQYVQEMKRTLEGQIKILMEQVTEKQQTNVRPNKGYTMTTLAPKYTGLLDVITTPAAYPKSTDVVGEIKTETVIPKNTSSVYTTTGTTSASTSSFRTITLFPKNVNVFHDMKVSFFCMATGSPSTDFFWEHNGKAISSGRKRYAIIDMTERSGSVLRIDRVRKRRDTGEITCVATNKYGTTRVVARLNVYDESKRIPDGYPRITQNPRLKAVEKGFTARLHCDAISVNSPELPIFYWLKDGIPVETNDPKFSIENGTLVIESAVELDAGKYECVAENSVGVAYSFSANLYVKVRRVPPYFSQEPRAVVNVVPGADVNLTCKAIGSPMPSISWKHSYQYFSGEPQLGQAVLVLRNVTHSGNVSCVAESWLGKIETQTSVLLVKQGKRTEILTPSIGGS